MIKQAEPQHLPFQAETQDTVFLRLEVMVQVQVRMQLIAVAERQQSIIYWQEIMSLPLLIMEVVVPQRLILVYLNPLLP